MPSILTRSVLLASLALLAIGAARPASAAVDLKMAGADFARPQASLVHWEYRHHHRVWVPDRRRDDRRRDDRR